MTVTRVLTVTVKLCQVIFCDVILGRSTDSDSQVMSSYLLWCHIRPHYRSCLSLCFSSCLSVCPVQASNSKTV